MHVNFDNATKLLSFSKPHNSIGVITYGAGAIGVRTAHSFVSELEESLPKERIPVEEFAKLLGVFYKEQWLRLQNTQGQMTFLVGGFDKGSPYGKTFEVIIPTHTDPILRHDTESFGITWGGQREVVDRVVKGYDSQLLTMVEESLDLDPTQLQILEKKLQPLELAIPIHAMPLQDCVDLAIFMVRTTIEAQRLTIGLRGCGGPIDVATITKKAGLKFVQSKEILGERYF